MRERIAGQVAAVGRLQKRSQKRTHSRYRAISCCPIALQALLQNKPAALSPVINEKAFTARVEELILGSFGFRRAILLFERKSANGERRNFSLLESEILRSRTNSLRSYSASSSDNDGRCAAMVSCLRLKTNNPTTASKITTAKVTPISNITNATDTPRLVRSHAVTRDFVRDWNFDQYLQ
ncbi:hypothetical protein M5K25_001229 [Dendrobium thyrsiflorum]|uniref:Uncharacterized protein n=1 Tax=Dendrobium thyrsiflorum TaxID=117978 RepID=A0ABD0VZG2_DENTH